jgi:hypothetical protein
MARRVALLHMSYARVLVDELGAERGLKLVRRAIWRYGTIVGERTRQAVQQQGLEPTLANMAAGSDLSPLAFPSTHVAVDGEERTQMGACPMAEIWREYGEEALGAQYCDVDPAKMQAYAPDWTMVHTRQLPRGDDCCEIATRPVAETG